MQRGLTFNMLYNNSSVPISTLVIIFKMWFIFGNLTLTLKKGTTQQDMNNDLGTIRKLEIVKDSIICY